MISVVIATNESERALVPTLAALVPAAAAGLVRDVIVTDGGSCDQTAEVADIAGCRFVASSDPLGARLKAAADMARGAWLLFLQPGVVPVHGWIDEAIAFLEQSDQLDAPKAATFRASRPASSAGAAIADALMFLRLALSGPQPSQGLLIAKRHYGEIGGHRAAAADPETDLLGRIGRRRLALLRSSAIAGRDTQI